MHHFQREKPRAATERSRERRTAGVGDEFKFFRSKNERETRMSNDKITLIIGLLRPTVEQRLTAVLIYISSRRPHPLRGPDFVQTR